MDEKTQEKSVKICTVCNKRIAEQLSASLSQWIYSHDVCRCRSDLVPVFEDQEKTQSAIIICRCCGKRIKETMEGSLTQWIFESHVCQCEKPEPVNLAEPDTSPEEIKPQLTGPPEEYLADTELLNDWDEDLSRYLPVKKLGQGGSGMVYLCYDTFLNKPVAIKLLNMPTEQQIISFQKEAKAASKLNHQNVIHILDFGITGSITPYMVMEYIDGVNLSSLIKEKSGLKLETALKIMITLASALEYLHSIGILHHDIKSSNVLVYSDEQDSLTPVLIDLGVAKLVGTEDKTERVGSVSSMAPEYLDSAPYDKRCEVYACGCLFFEILSGHLPFENDTILETINDHKTGSIPSIYDLCPNLKEIPAIDSTLKKCLAKNPGERYQTISEMQSGLTEILADLEAELEANENPEVEQSPIEGPLKTTGLKPSPLIIAAVFFLSIFIVSAIGLMFYGNAPETGNTTKTKMISNKSISEKADEALKQAKPEFHVDTENRVTATGILVDEDLKEAAARFPKNRKWRLKETDITGEGLKYLIKNDLTLLDVNRSHLKGENLKYVAQMKSLKNLNLNQCSYLKDEDLNVLSNLSKLERITVSGSGITGNVFKVLARVSSLAAIHVRKIKFKGDEPKALGKLKNLTSLRLGDCRLDEKTMASIVSLPNLVELNLCDCKITEKAAGALSRSKRIRTLIMRRAEISQAGLLELRKMTQLIRLDLADIQLQPLTRMELNRCLKGCRIQN